MEVRVLKAFKLVLDTCIQAVLMLSNGEFSDVSALEVLSSMEIQTLNSALVNLLDSLTEKVHKLKEVEKKKKYSLIFLTYL